jgi:hypothetical protein
MSNKGRVLEVAISKAKPGVTREQILATVDAVSEWVKTQPGFVSRDLTYSPADETWIDVIWWESLEAAHTAAERAMTSEACAPLFSLIDLEGTQMLHAERMISPVMRDEAA